MRERNCLISLTKKERGFKGGGKNQIVRRGEERESGAAELHRTQHKGYLILHSSFFTLHLNTKYTAAIRQAKAAK